jgi:hypothetical protein
MPQNTLQFESFASKNKAEADAGDTSCNPSYSGGRDKEDGGSKPAQANSPEDPILKISNTKKGWQSGSSGRMPV